ncbi:MAG: exodeoxyribonuclease VII small subunit [Oligoflexia bacterium]|nr:exodeoxyribonuclease VII small subunit [Oligoflexia bacterium]
MPTQQPEPAQAEPAQPKRTFEDTLALLEDHVRRLDSGELPLEDALGVFEQGVGLVRECQQLLDDADRRIVELSPGPQGIEEHSFDGGARGQD